MTTTFRIPYVVPNGENSWGPPLTVVTDAVPVVLDEDNNDTEDAVVGGSYVPALMKFATVPYAPFGRSDRLGRAADFTGGSGGPGGHGFGGGSGGGMMNDRMMMMNNNFSQSRYGDRNNNNRERGGKYNRYNDQQLDDINEGKVNDFDNDDSAFQLVDTTKAPTAKRFVNPSSKRRQNSMRLRQINARRGGPGPGGAGNGGPVLDKMTGRGGSGGPGGGRGSGPGGSGGRGGQDGGRFGSGGGRFAPGGRGGAPGGRGGRGSGGFFSHRQIDRQPSVAVQTDWKQVEEIALGKLSKSLALAASASDAKSIAAMIPKVTDVLWCGFVDPYNEAYEKVSAKAPQPLKRMEHKEFYPVTTTDDPVLEKLAVDGAGNVFITDAILAHIMTSTRSVYPWDIVITKLPGGTMFFDKRDNSQFDYLTVHETSYVPPIDEEGGINSPERLGLEATMINQNFSQQILKSTKAVLAKERKHMELPNPFFDEDDAQGMEPASTAFRYRKYVLDEKTTVIVRTELHATVKNGTQYMTSYALNEYSPSAMNLAMTNPNNMLLSWRDKIDSQRGAVLATEFKNNSFKIAKWTAMSLLAGADLMKMGFVTRANPKNPMEHILLASQFYRPKDLATQITLQESQMWSIFRMVINMLQKPSAVDGKYVLMRDPNKPFLYLYKVPDNTFEDDE
jgi:translation initiation factor 3 subunit D